MSRAEHLATPANWPRVGARDSQSAGRHRRRHEIIGRDLPPASPARAVVKDVRLEVAKSIAS